MLLGVTGSGKTFTMAKIIERTQRPALVLAPNKTLAAQLYGEFKTFFPDNAVEYFVSYYDYYQPEAYVPRTDTYIEKESSINEQIDRMRHSATRALLERDDVVVVASVSCIYGIGDVETYSAMTFTVKRGQRLSQRQLLADLVALHYKRNDGNFSRKALVSRLNVELANDLGNLAQRSLSLLARNCGGALPARGPVTDEDAAMLGACRRIRRSTTPPRRCKSAATSGSSRSRRSSRTPIACR